MHCTVYIYIYIYINTLLIISDAIPALFKSICDRIKLKKTVAYLARRTTENNCTDRPAECISDDEDRGT